MQWGPGFVFTDSVAHWCVIVHYVGVMAAHGVSQIGIFATSHPTPPSIPPTPYNSNTDIRKRW